MRLRLATMAALGLPSVVPACADGDGPAPVRVEVVRDFVEPADTHGSAGAIGFADGARVTGVQISPAPATPGAALEVSWAVEGGSEGGRIRLGVVPPSRGARQALRSRDSRVPGPDRREQWVDVDGAGPAVVTLPVPWHPRSATVLMERVDGAGTRIAAVDGPRTAGGVAVLASVPVEGEPTSVVAARRGAPTLDGRIDDWSGEGTPLVRSVDGEPHPGDPTRVWFGWDEQNLYVAADLPDRDVWSKYREQDDPLYKGEVFEVFVAGTNEGRDYVELEVSARNVTFDAHFATYRRGDEAWDSTWRTAVDVRGTVDDRDDRDQGWSVEAAIPWAELCEKTAVTCPPSADQRIRVNVFRLEHPKGAPAYGLALSPTRKPDFHAWDNAAVLRLGS